MMGTILVAVTPDLAVDQRSIGLANGGVTCAFGTSSGSVASTEATELLDVATKRQMSGIHNLFRRGSWLRRR